MRLPFFFSLSPQHNTTQQLTEADIMQKLHHKNIIQSVSVPLTLHSTYSRAPCRYREVINVSSKMVLILMEFANGGDLMNRIDQEKLLGRKFQEDVILRWMAEALQVQTTAL
jgi:serine/threonine protein kinase